MLMGITFRRKISDELEKWKNTEGHRPLTLKGLRQVGKTTAVKEFAKKNYDNVFFLDLRKDTSLHSIFAGDFDIDEIALSISSSPKAKRLVEGSKMIPGKTLIILDEIQDCADARSSLRYFKEDGRYDVIATGSMLGVKGYNQAPSRGIPVGSEDTLVMNAMDFEEFCWAMGIAEDAISCLKECFAKRKHIPPYIHQMMLETVRKYMCVGGLPEVVSTFLSSNDMMITRKVQKGLIATYQSDFGTHLNKDGEIVVDPLEQAYINEVFSSIPRQLAKENGKFMYSCVSKTAKGRTHADAISWLKDYGLIDVCHNLSSIDSPLDFFSLDNQFKIYLSDIGLLTAMLDEDTSFNVLNNLLKVGKGPLYENLVAETFHKMQKPYYYFAKSSGLEVDFVAKLFQGTAILEVKARDGNAKSSKEVLHNPNCHIDKLIKLSAQDIGVIDNFITMPYYLPIFVFGD